MIDHSEDGCLTIRSDDSGVELCGLEYPHGDALAWYEARLFGSGLNATVGVEAIGDHGLATFLSQLGEQGPWEGERAWSALSGLGLTAAVNDRGNVTLTFEVRGRAWDSPWSARAAVGVDLGDLAALSKAVGYWFAHASPS